MQRNAVAMRTAIQYDCAVTGLFWCDRYCKADAHENGNKEVMAEAEGLLKQMNANLEQVRCY